MVQIYRALFKWPGFQSRSSEHKNHRRAIIAFFSRYTKIYTASLEVKQALRLAAGRAFLWKASHVYVDYHLLNRKYKTLSR